MLTAFGLVLVLAADMANLGDVMSLMGRHQEARAALAKAMSIDAELVRRYPKTAQFSRIRFHRLLIGGRIFYLHGNYAQALGYYQDAREILIGMTTLDPKNQGSRLRLGVAYNGMGSALVRLNELDAASQAYQNALEVLSKTLDGGSPSQDAVYAAATAHAGVGEVAAARAVAASPNPAARVARLRQALASTDRSLELWQRVKEPGLTSPEGYPCKPLHEVKTQRAQINAELAAIDAVR